MKLEVITYQEFDVAVAQCLLNLSPTEEQFLQLGYELLLSTIKRNQLEKDLDVIKSSKKKSSNMDEM